MATEMRVHFQPLERPDRVEGVARLLLRRGRLEPHVFVLCPDAGFMARLDERLWTIDAESFLAHGIVSEDPEENAAQPILLGLEVRRDNAPAVLINGGLEVPPDLDGFAHVVDFVDGWDARLVQAARERWRCYRNMGLAPQYLGAGGPKAR
ncbi:MAG: DNA polymerase III subunit chi [Mariprofundaceae bacterium]